MRETFLMPRSTWDTYETWRPSFALRSSWVSPRECLQFRTSAPKAEWAGLRTFIQPKRSLDTHYKSRDYKSIFLRNGDTNVQ